VSGECEVSPDKGGVSSGAGGGPVEEDRVLSEAGRGLLRCSSLPPTGAGVPPTDAGVPPTGAGVPPTGAGVPPTDAGVPPTDAGVPSGRSGLPPGSGLPAVAQTFLFWKWPLGHLERCRARYGSRFTLRATGYPPFVFLSDVQDLKAISTAPADVLHPGVGGATLRPLIGESSFMLLDEAEHLAGRKTVLPCFHEKVVQRHAELVEEIVRREIASWPRGTPFALHSHLHALTLEIILRAIFGPEMDDRLRELRDRLLQMLSITASTVLSEPILRHGPGGRTWRDFLHRRAQVDELIFALLEQRRAVRTGEGDTIPAASGDLLGSLLAAHNADGSAMTSRQVRDNIMTIIVSGHETAASELEWAFQLLSHNRTALDRLVGEIDEANSEEYLTATVQEVMRHRPAFLFMIPRAVRRSIEINGWTYGPPAYLLGCTYLMHHNPSLYPDPHEFRPERFLEAPPEAHTWLPWGEGRRRCPGRHMAMLEMKTVLRTVLSSVTLRPAARNIEHPRWRSVVVTPHAGSRVVLHSRQRHIVRTRLLS
jgi:cytochrome P450